MKPLSLLAASLAVAPAFAPATGSEDPVYEKLHAVCVGIHNSGECARRIEASHKGSETAARFVRSGPSLSVVASSRSFSLRDRDNADGDIEYSYLAYLKRPEIHVVRRQYGEGNKFTVIGNRDDRSHVVPGFPILSPSASRFLSYSEAGESGYNADAIEFWRVTSGRLSREAQLKPSFSGCQIKVVKWLSESVVQLTGVSNVGSLGSKACRLSLKYQNQRWVPA